MKRSLLKIIVFLGLVTMLMSGCMYTKVQRPYDRDYDKTELGTKEGRSSLQSIFWFISWGDAGTKAAAENGGIRVIRHADAEYYMVFMGLYARVTTVVYGD
ncbi:MAG: hypothetical protein JRI49_05795 [Deltaproteobacteria bacterium]|nr:hypothetical protein [Deltaproteobacteria bacterium]